MHSSVMLEANKFLKALPEDQLIAELGSLNLNGSVKDGLEYRGRKIVGFDIVSGPGVDVVIDLSKPIPSAYKNIFDHVVSISSFQMCPDSNLYLQECMDLLKLDSDSQLFVTMCSFTCFRKHSTSQNLYNFSDSVRMTKRNVEKFFNNYFKQVQVKRISSTPIRLHFDYIITCKSRKNTHL